ncbi:MAG: hypothetical protein JW953_01305 [Anaerolineae bacterium]|nr:hypothetical protein [Anaerolineae bacterium]
MALPEPPSGVSNKFIFLIIGLVVACPALLCLAIGLLYGLFLLFASSSGVAPFVYTLF